MADTWQIREAVKKALNCSAGLLLASPAAVPGMNGRRVGRGSGNALEFAEYREYRAGDDLRRLDWQVFARSEKLMVKLFSQEIDPRCDIICDASASMAVHGGAKGAAMYGLAALLAQAAVNGNFTLKVWHSGEMLLPEAEPESPLSWQLGGFTSPVSPNETLSAFAGKFQGRGIRIILSDLLWESPPEAFLRRLGDGAMYCFVIEILSRYDLVPELAGNTLVTDSESGEERELIIDSAMLNRYRDRLSRHRSEWASAVSRYGMKLISIEAESFLENWELGELFKGGLLSC